MSARTRAVCAQIISEVAFGGHSLTEVLAKSIPSSFSQQDKSFIKAMCFGTLRSQLKWNFMIEQSIKKPLRARDNDIRALISLGLYQLLESNVADHAAISETVAACVKLKKLWAKGMINAILRNLQRDPQKFDSQLQKKIWLNDAFPEWIYQKVHQDWGEKSADILKASNRKGPMTVRVNCNHYNIDNYQALLREQEIESQSHPLAKSALVLQQPVTVNKLPGFEKGAVSVQDASAQMAADLLQLEKLTTVSSPMILDACSAPGGKTGHILETLSALKIHNSRVLALDKDRYRLQSVQENLTRLQQQAELISADASDLKSWHQGQMFDRILIDAPCSGTGVIRRHPDIKLLRRATDINDLIQTQRQLLSTLWTLVKPGGMLLYATCSIFKAENEQQIAWFLTQQQDAELLPIEQEKPLKNILGWQIKPGWHDMDGFYYAPLQKKTPQQ